MSNKITRSYAMTHTMPRIPTDAMVEAGRQAGDHRIIKEPEGSELPYRFEPACDYAEVYNIWQAMFDAALKETP